jgi:hypothetical protein
VIFGLDVTLSQALRFHAIAFATSAFPEAMVGSAQIAISRKLPPDKSDFAFCVKRGDVQ